MKYKRILLKLSGEALIGNKNFGIDSNKLENYSSEIKNIQNLGIEVAIVIGGGNIYRGIESEKTGIDRVQGDYMGMIKLSSRIDIYLPINDVNLLVKENISIESTKIYNFVCLKSNNIFSKLNSFIITFFL